MDSLIRKACELGEKTAHCSVEVILNAALWMEEKYRCCFDSRYRYAAS